MTDAVIFDRAWIVDQIAQAGVAVTRIVPSEIKRLQWTICLERIESGTIAVGFSKIEIPRIARPRIS